MTTGRSQPALEAAVKKLIKRSIRLTAAPRDLAFCLLHGLRWDPTCLLHGLPLVRQRTRGSITIGPGWTACSDARHNSIGVFQRVILRVTTREGRIRIGQNVGMSGCTISSRVSIEIGDDVLIGSGVLITDSDAHAIHPDERSDLTRIKAAPIRIGPRVFVGARAIILKGVTIGEGAVVGAGAVVSKDVPPYGIVAGNPARLVGDSRRAGATATRPEHPAKPERPVQH